MSSTQVTGNNRELCVIFRLVKVKLFSPAQNHQKYYISLKIKNQIWSSKAKPILKQTIKYSDTHSLELPTNPTLQIFLLKDRIFLKPEVICSSSVKLNLNKPKTTDWFVLFKAQKEVGEVLISYFIEEKTENFCTLKTLREVDLAKEEVRFFINKYLKKLQKLKGIKKKFREEAWSLLGKMEDKLEMTEKITGSYGNENGVVSGPSAE